METSLANWFYAALAGTLGIVVSVAICMHLQFTAETTRTLYFEGLIDQRTAELQRMANEYRISLQNTASMITAMGHKELTPERFRKYVESMALKQHFPGALGLAFVRKVPIQAESEFLQEMEEKGMKDFQIKFIRPSSQDRFVMQYIEPLQGNYAAQGLDLGSEDVRRENALSAFSRAGLAVSKPITMIQNAEAGRLGFTMLMPVFSTTTPSQDMGTRYEELVGWVSFPISMDRFLSDWLAQAQNLQIRIFMLGETEKPALFIDTVETKTEALYRGTSFSRDIQFGNKRWRLEYWPAESGLTKRFDTTYLAWMLLGILLSIAAAFKLKRMLDRNKVLALHQHLVNNSSQALIAENSLGQILVWNKAAETLFGHDQASVLYDQEQNLTVPDELLTLERRLYQRAAQGETLNNIQTLRISDSAQTVHLRMNMAPIFNGKNQLVGYTKSFRDETEERQVWKDMHAMEELVGHAPDGVITLDHARRIKLANPAAVLLLQGTEITSTLIEQRITDLLAPDVLIEFENQVLLPLYKNNRVEVVFNWPVQGHTEHVQLIFRGFTLNNPKLEESLWALRFEKKSRSYTPIYD